jgi:tRNA A37 threonylcarbamoyladenosine synthetase subunit TsaC/SUA5/YrdC
MYRKIAVRVGEVCIPWDDIRKKLSFPLFLTSANKSGEKECHTHREVASIFQEGISILGERSE